MRQIIFEVISRDEISGVSMRQLTIEEMKSFNNKTVKYLAQKTFENGGKEFTSGKWSVKMK